MKCIGEHLLDEVRVELLVPAGIQRRGGIQAFTVQTQLQHLTPTMHRVTTHRHSLRLILHTTRTHLYTVFIKNTHSHVFFHIPPNKQGGI